MPFGKGDKVKGLAVEDNAVDRIFEFSFEASGSGDTAIGVLRDAGTG